MVLDDTRGLVCVFVTPWYNIGYRLGSRLFTFGMMVFEMLERRPG